MMFSWLCNLHVHPSRSGPTYAAGENGGGLAYGWSPESGPSGRAFGWTVATDRGLVTYLFRDLRDAATAHQLAESCEGIGPKAAATLIGRFGTLGLARAVQEAGKDTFKGMDVGPKKLAALKRFFEGQVVEETGQTTSDGVIIQSAVALGFPAEEVRAAIAALRGSAWPVDLGHVLARIREVRSRPVAP